MRRFIGMAFVTVLVCGLGSPARADADKDAKAILDKAIKALGGEKKLSAIKATTWKAKGVLSVGGNDNSFTSQTTARGLDHYRHVFEGEFGDNKVKGVTIVNGDKAWLKFGDRSMEMDKAGVANEKRSLYLQMVPVTLLPLRQKGFKVEAAGEEKVGGKPAVAIKVVGPDGKDFKLYFDKKSGLPVKEVAKVDGFMGEEFTQETTFGSYKDFHGSRRPPKSRASATARNSWMRRSPSSRSLTRWTPRRFPGRSKAAANLRLNRQRKRDAARFRIEPRPPLIQSSTASTCRGLLRARGSPR